MTAKLAIIYTARLALFTGMLLLAATQVPAQSSCVGDCSDSQTVTVDEILKMVNIALGNIAFSECPAGDENDDNQITVEEILRGVNFALNGCPPVPTATPTPISPTATPTSIVVAMPRIDAGSTSGAPDQVVSIPVTLSQSLGQVIATATDLSFDSARVTAVLDGGEPDCTIDPSIGAGSAANKMLLRALLPRDNGQAIVRIGVVSFQNFNAIPDGPLFVCRFRIAAQASGEITLSNQSEASNAAGDTLTTSGSNATITVSN